MRPAIHLLAAAATLGMFTGPAFALCDLCSASVRLDDTLANCFLERADAEAEKLTAAGSAFVIVDLSDCEGRGSLPTGATTDAAQRPLDENFIADASAIACLSDAIVALEDGAGPGHDFDLASLCP
ncbi:MAG: hypothetical protein ABL879_10280 [Devosia sp.]